jgi:hypothetical protein
VNYALGHPQLGKPFRSYLLDLAGDLKRRKAPAAAARKPSGGRSRQGRPKKR